ncbi:MAG: MlaD family protein [Actinomycetota bacterium]
MIATAVWYIYGLGVRVGAPSDRVNLSMNVPDINGLLVGSNVLLRGVPVGKIEKISTTASDATVDFYVDGRYPIPVDSEVRLASLSALGEPFIGFTPRGDGGPMLRDGQRIATERIINPPSISELAVSLSRVLNQADPAALKRVVDELNTGLPDPTVVLPNIARTSLLVRNMAANLNGSGQALFDNYQTLVRNAGWLGPLLADIAPGLRTVGISAGVLFSGLEINRPLGAPDIYVQVNRLIDRLQKLLDDNGGDLKVLGQAMLPHLKGIGGALMNFDTGQILAHILESVPQEGAVTLHVRVP